MSSCTLSMEHEMAISLHRELQSQLLSLQWVRVAGAVQSVKASALGGASCHITVCLCFLLREMRNRASVQIAFCMSPRGVATLDMAESFGREDWIQEAVCAPHLTPTSGMTGRWFGGGQKVAINCQRRVPGAHGHHPSQL